MGGCGLRRFAGTVCAELFRPTEAGRRPRRADGIALLAGAMLPLAFAPIHWFPLSIVACALLFAVWSHATPARAAWRGWLFGLGLFGVGTSWIFISIHRFGQAPVPVAVLMTAGLIAGLALFPALAGWCARRSAAPERPIRQLVLVFPAVWGLVEWLRSWVLTGFPWLSLGYSQAETPLAGLAPLLGIFGMSWAVAISAGLLLVALRGGGRRALWGLLAGCALWLLAGGLNGVTWTQPLPEDDALQVALLQGNVPQDMKWRADAQGLILERYRRLTEAHWGKDLVVWPETALPLFYHHVADGYLADLEQAAAAHGTSVLMGVPLQEAATGRYFNSALGLGMDQGRWFYHKRHLVPFGEYIPLRDWLRFAERWLSIPLSNFSSGPDHQPPLSVQDQRVAASICYEVAFGAELVRDVPDATMLINISNDAWFGDSLAPWQHLQMAQLRAREAERVLLRATNTGITAVIGADGQVAAQMPPFQVGALTATVPGRTGVTPYVRFGDAPLVLLLALIWAGGALRLRRCAAPVATAEH